MEGKDLDQIYEEEIKKEFSIKLYPIKDDNNNINWVAEIPELPGCIGAGDTPQEAVIAVEDAKKSWIEIAVYDKKKIQEPSNLYDIDYSGKFTLRLPKTLHKELAEIAELEGVSLNQYILFIISKSHYEFQTSRIEIALRDEIKRVIKAPFIQNIKWPHKEHEEEFEYGRRLKIVK